MNTRPNIILREVQQPIPGEFDSEFAQSDRNRIYNLGIFSTVDVFRQDSVYVILVVEALRIFPIPTIEYNENKGVKGWTYGATLIYSNFRGLNERLEAGGTQGNTTSYFLDFFDPWLWGNRGSIFFSVADQYKDDDAYPIGIRLRKLQIGSGFEIRHIHKFSFLGALKQRDLQLTDDNFDITSIEYLTRYRYAELTMGYLYDTRDIYWDPTMGIIAGCTWTFDIGLSGSASINRLDLMGNYYHKLWWEKGEPVISLKSRVILQTKGKLPIFQQLYLGGKEFVRGYYNIPSENVSSATDQIQVQDLVYQTLEVQQTLLQKKDLKGIEVGADFVIFLDYGYGANSPGNLKIANGLVGYGFGFRFFASSLGTIAIDLGFNPHQSDARIHIRD